MKGYCEGCSSIVDIDVPPDGHIVPIHDCGGDERACQVRCPIQGLCGPIREMRVLGIDVGGVIVNKAGDFGDTSFFSDRYLETPPTEQVFEVLERVVPMFDDVLIISKCGRNIQRKTMEWMDHHDFYGKTGISRSKFNFCLKRPEKVGIAQFWGVTHYVDDRIDIIKSMKDVVPHLFLFAPDIKATVSQGGFHMVPSWSKLERLLEVLDKRSKA